MQVICISNDIATLSCVIITISSSAINPKRQDYNSLHVPFSNHTLELPVKMYTYTYCYKCYLSATCYNIKPANEIVPH